MPEEKAAQAEISPLRGGGSCSRRVLLESSNPDLPSPPCPSHTCYSVDSCVLEERPPFSPDSVVLQHAAGRW